MDYKKMMGYGDKKKVTKKQAKPKKNQVLESVKKDLNEWNDRTFKDLPKRWSGAYNRKDGLSEFEQQGGKDFIKEGPAYEYEKYLKNIEKTENQQAKAVNNFVKLLKKKGFSKEATNVAYTYMGTMRKFNDYLEELKDKLL